MFIIDAPAFRRLVSLPDLWVEVGGQAPHILRAFADIRADRVRYRVKYAFARPGYERMLRDCVSGLTERDRVRELTFMGDAVRPRHWEPFLGVRRRGLKALQAVQREHDLDADDADQLLTTLRASFQNLIERNRRV